jgi:nucleoside-diphosphate-sugar epimerase
MAAQNDLVLITGATGYLGYHVLLDALKAGYRARVAIRSESKKNKVLNAPSLKALNLKDGQLSWVVVPDMAAPGAYDEAVKGVKYVIHVASPIPTFGGPNPPAPENFESYFVKPAIAGDLGMMRSASKESSIKRVVLTSSAVAITPFEYYMGKGDKDRVFTSSDRIPYAEGPWAFEFEAYSAGKAAALNSAEKFVREEKPSFDLIPIIPGWIFGHNELVTEAHEMKAESTNSVLLSFLTGFKNPMPFNGNMVRGEDAAKIHVLALDPAVKGNRAFLASTDAVWEDAHAILKERYADAVKEGKLSLEGEQGTLHISALGDETEKAFNVKFQPYEKMVTEVVDQYLELSKA